MNSRTAAASMTVHRNAEGYLSHTHPLGDSGNTSWATDASCTHCWCTATRRVSPGRGTRRCTMVGSCAYAACPAALQLYLVCGRYCPLRSCVRFVHVRWPRLPGCQVPRFPVGRRPSSAGWLAAGDIPSAVTGLRVRSASHRRSFPRPPYVAIGPGPLGCRRPRLHLACPKGIAS